MQTLAKRIILYGLTIMLLVAASGFATSDQDNSEYPAKKVTSTTETYESMLERLLSGDRTVSFLQLRQSFVASEVYAPYGGTGESHSVLLLELYQNQGPQAVIREAERIIEIDFFDIIAHSYLSLAYSESTQPEKAQFEKFLANEIIESVLSSGDGKSLETAFQVLTVREENVILSLMSLEKQEQALFEANGHTYDFITATHTETNESQGIWFNIDWLVIGANNTFLNDE